MSTFTMTKNWDDGTVLTESQLDDIKTSVETFLNSTKLDSTNIQTGGIATANYAALSVDAAALASSAVTTAKLNDNAVTRAKLAAVGQQISSSSGEYSTTNNTPQDVTNLSVSLTVTGRPVYLSLINDGSGNPGFFRSSSAGSSTIAEVLFLEGSTEIYRASLEGPGTTIRVPVSSVHHIYVPSAGTYTYKCQLRANTGETAYIHYAKLIAYEL